jgi:hypothetical protein
LSRSSCLPSLTSVVEQPQTTKKCGDHQPGRALRYANWLRAPPPTRWDTTATLAPPIAYRCARSLLLECPFSWSSIASFAFAANYHFPPFPLTRPAEAV